MKAILPGSKKAEKMHREILTECFVYATALALNDIYRFGRKRTQRIVDALNEIMTGYAEQDGAEIREAMLAELRGRGLEFEIKGRR